MSGCQDCGACCSDFAAARDGVIVWLTTDDARRLRRRDPRLVITVSPAPALPADLGLAANKEGRCLALDGDIGDRVSCRVYDDRPHPCRAFEPGSAGCQNARDEAFLLPLPEDGLTGVTRKS